MVKLFALVLLAACSTQLGSGELVESGQSMGGFCNKIIEPFCYLTAEYGTNGEITIKANSSSATARGALTEQGAAELDSLIALLPLSPPKDVVCPDAPGIDFAVRSDEDLYTYRDSCRRFPAGPLSHMAEFISDVHRTIIHGTCADNPNARVTCAPP